MKSRCDCSTARLPRYRHYQAMVSTYERPYYSFRAPVVGFIENPSPSHVPLRVQQFVLYFLIYRSFSGPYLYNSTGRVSAVYSVHLFIQHDK